MEFGVQCTASLIDLIGLIDFDLSQIFVKFGGDILWSLDLYKDSYEIINFCNYSEIHLKMYLSYD